MYSTTNLAGESGRQGAIEVPYLDVFVCEDAYLHRRPFARIPADYEKFYNTIQLAVVDAVDRRRGIPETARSLVFEAFVGLVVRVETRWGEAPSIPSTRGAPQGSVSAPEIAAPAQEPIIRLRESSPAQYTTSAGQRVSCAGSVEDTEHYGRKY